MVASGENAILRKGGRPTREEAEQIGGQILATASEMFLDQGYGTTSIEAIAQRLRISKRTFYHRFKDKAALFEAAVHSIVGRLRPPDMTRLFSGGTIEEILLRLGGLALQAALSPDGLALQRLVIAEASRFPELAAIAAGEGTRRIAVEAIAGLLRRDPLSLPLSPDMAQFAAEQFLQMIISQPQRRALVLGSLMDEEEQKAWVESSVALFLHGSRKAVESGHPPADSR